MQAIGLIETKGLITAIEAADTMLKSSDVSIVEKTYVGGGLVTVIVTGDVGSVKAAIEAGSAAVKKINPEYLISDHIMPRPSEELKTIIGPKATVEGLKVTPSPVQDINLQPKEEVTQVEDKEPVKGLADTKQQVKEMDLDKLHKNDVDKLVSEDGIEKAILILDKLKVVKLRNLAREYEDFVITGRVISKADKKLLIIKFKAYYEKNSKI